MEDGEQGRNPRRILEVESGGAGDGVWMMIIPGLWTHHSISSSDQGTELSLQSIVFTLCFLSICWVHGLEFSFEALSTAIFKGKRLSLIENHGGFQKACHTNMKQYTLFLVWVYFWVTKTLQILMRSEMDWNSQRNACAYKMVHTYISLKTIC